MIDHILTVEAIRLVRRLVGGMQKKKKVEGMFIVEGALS